MKDHRDHNVEFNNVAVRNKKKEVMESLKPLREVKEYLHREFIGMEKVKNEVQAQVRELTGEIEMSFDVLQQILQACKT